MNADNAYNADNLYLPNQPDLKYLFFRNLDLMPYLVLGEHCVKYRNFK